MLQISNRIERSSINRWFDSKLEMFKTKAEKFPVPYSLIGYTKSVFLVMHPPPVSSPFIPC
jgi:hypothetical protein